MFIAVYLFIIIVCIVYFEKCLRRNAKFPELSRRLPFIGHAHLFVGDSVHLWKIAQRISRESLQNGGLVTISFGPKKVYAVTDPEDINTVANLSMEKSYIYGFSRPWLGDGLFTADVLTWRNNRRLLNQAFKHTILDGFVDVFNNQARSLVDELAAEADLEKIYILNKLSLHSLRLVFKTILGVSDQEVTPEKFNSYLETNNILHNIFTKRFQKFWLHSDIVFNRTKLKIEQDYAVAVLHGVNAMVLKNRKEIRRLNLENGTQDYSGEQKPFIDLLIEIAEEKGLSDMEVIHELATFIAAGHDTVPYTLLYTLMCVGSHPPVQQRIYEELQQVLGSDDVTKQNLSSLVYLEATIKETMRLYPIAPVVSRVTDCDVKLSKYFELRTFSLFEILQYHQGPVSLCLHHHPVWGSDVEHFKPERWLDPTTLPENAFAGFSTGKRNCIGKTFAMMSMKTTLAHLLRQYRVTADITRMEAKLDIILKPAFNHWISLEWRDK
ncbi:cytochrome P450 4V2 [Bombyx mori]|uniref:cytochrome P450 4V2 n=1 Tax=Bombyx mori TaxID=7091 RepID=UPI002ED2CD0B